jgi:hypothetical protein
MKKSITCIMLCLLILSTIPLTSGQINNFQNDPLGGTTRVSFIIGRIRLSYDRHEQQLVMYAILVIDGQQGIISDELMRVPSRFVGMLTCRFICGIYSYIELGPGWG